MCKENCSECLQDKSCCDGVYYPLVESCRDDCIHADECGREGISSKACRECVFYEVEE